MGSGGWRFGAGRPGWKRKAESSLAFDIRKVARRNLLVPGKAFTWKWTNGDGEEIGSIAVVVTGNPETLRLHYQWSIDNDPPNRTECSIAIDRTRCHYGGNRPWFLCPKCGRRCGVLYFRGRGAGLYQCRACAGIAYASQCQDSVGRSWIKQGKIEARLLDGWHKPKGMHWKTYERLRKVVIGCEQIRDDALVVMQQRWGSLV